MTENQFNDNPILGFINQLVNIKGFDEIKELKSVAKRAQNKGFTDAAFQAMMREVGWSSGQAWCAYYVKLIYMQFFSFDRQWLDRNFTGSAVGNFNQVANLNRAKDFRYITVTTNTPQVSDIVVWGQVGRGHTGIVTEVINNNKVVSLEGNTTLAGVREGDGSRKLTRNVTVGLNNREGKRFLGYIRRNFTKQELEKLYFDENEQTLKFR
jgi:surface antigen